MFGRFVRYLRDRRGAISPMMVLLLIPLTGVMAMAGEASFWFMTQRALQNAADSAAVAAATNNDYTTVVTATNGVQYHPFEIEARAVASSYGFVSGVNNITVTPVRQVPCVSPSSVPACYKVTIRQDVPLYLTQVVGYRGDATIGQRFAKIVVGDAVARASSVTDYCLLALSTANDAINCNGCPAAAMTGCNVATNGTANCTGHDLDADRVDVAGNSNSCWSPPDQGSTNNPLFTDTRFRNLASQIPANTCSPANNKATYQSEQTVTGTLTLTSTPKIYCGDVNVTSNLTVNSPSGGGVIVIENGNLNVSAGKTLTGNNLTVIFTGPTIGGFNPGHSVPGDGTLDITAPTSGTWSGVALYQDPALTSGVDITWTGNSPTWNITGLIYMPDADLGFRGIINKSTAGANCTALIVNTIDVRGTAKILSNYTGCAAAGLIPPQGSGSRQSLIQ